MPRRYVILHHTRAEEAHWDFMLEEADALATWQCDQNPADLAVGQSLAITALPAHRKAYLDYEGPISNSRGKVARVAAGEIISLSRHGQTLRFTLTGSADGSYRITSADDANACTLTRET